MPFLVLWVLFWTACTIGIDHEIGQSVVRQFSSRTFPATTGRMLESEVTRYHRRRSGASYGLELKYRYEVAGRTYEATRYRYGDKHDWNESVHAVAASLPAGAPVIVYYNSADPADALLVPGLQGRDLFSLLFLMPFNIVAIVSWYFGYAALRRRIAPPLAAGARILSRGTCIALRLPEVSPAGAALAIGFAASFGALLVIGIGFGSRPPWCLMLVIWWSIVLAMVWAYWNQVRDSRNMLIDWLHRRLYLPLTFGRRESVCMPLTSIAEVAVDEQIHKSKRGRTSRLYHTMLVWRDAVGNLRRDKLAEHSNPSDARSLAAWLDEQIRRPGSNLANDRHAST
jgi:hypothetical protein